MISKFTKIVIMSFSLIILSVNISYSRVSYTRNSHANFGNLQPNKPDFFNVSMIPLSSTPSVSSGDVVMSGTPYLGHVTLTTNKTGISYYADASLQLERNGKIIDFTPSLTHTGDLDSSVEVYIGGTITNSSLDLESGRYRGKLTIYYSDTQSSNSKTINIDVTLDDIPISVNMTKSNVDMGTIVINDGKRVVFTIEQDASLTHTRGDYTIEGSQSLATFEVVGTPAEGITFAEYDTPISDGNGNEITVKPITANGTLNNLGFYSSTVGMKIDIPAGTPMGTYSGNYSVDVNY